MAIAKLSGLAGKSGGGGRGTRRLSSATRAKIAMAQRAGCAKVKAKKGRQYSTAEGPPSFHNGAGFFCARR